MLLFFKQFAPRVTALLLCINAAGSGAQAPHDHAAMLAARPASAEPPAASASATLAYESVFTRYKSYRDEKAGAWRDANDTVDRIGGWRAYAKEAQQPDSAAPAAPVTSPPSMSGVPPAIAPKPDPHAGHGRKP